MSTASFEDALKQCLSFVGAKHEYTLRIQGVAAAGRRQLLHRVRENLKGSRPVAYIEIPDEDPDAGALALLQLGQVSTNGAVAICRDIHRGFSEKVDSVLQSVPADTVVLLYAPWRQREGADAYHTRAHGRLFELMNALLAKQLKVVAVSEELPGVVRTVRLDKWKADGEWGQEEFQGSSLQKYADEFLTKSRENSRLEVRLAIGLLALGESASNVDSLVNRYNCLVPLGSALWERATDWLKQAWSFTALSRKPFIAMNSQEGVPDFNFLYSCIGQPLEAKEKDVLHKCLGFERDHLFVLHETIIKAGQTASVGLQSPDSHLRKAHRAWAEYFERSGKEWRALERRLHESFHAVRDGHLPDFPFFQDQYVLAGRYLSRELRQFEKAATCYERAVELDPTDAYSQHYLAYNRSRMKPPPPSALVEQPYQKAIEQEPFNVYWYPRYISWRLRHGQFRAARELWDKAVAETQAKRALESHYDFLHREVFATAIFLDLELCHRIIDDLPPQIRPLDRFRRMRLLTRLYELSLEERDVVPATVVPKVREMNLLGPHLLPSKLKGEELQTWFAAKVVEIEGDHVDLVCGTTENREEKFWTETLTREDFDSPGSDTELEQLFDGSFIEVGNYGATRLIRAHDSSTVNLRELLEFR